MRGRIKSVEQVAGDMFKEWGEENKQYSNEKLRAASEQRLDETRDRYRELVGVMKQASSKMDPVLAAFKDQVLYLKHNLNASAIASLQDTSAEIESDVATLIRDMETSINEANEFISQINKQQS